MFTLKVVHGAGIYVQVFDGTLMIHQQNMAWGCNVFGYLGNTYCLFGPNNNVLGSENSYTLYQLTKLVEAPAVN